MNRDSALALEEAFIKELAGLRGHLAELEARAGINNRAAEDYARDRNRNQYFSVEDVALRKELIRQRRAGDSTYESHMRPQRVAAQKKLAKAKRLAESMAPWISAAVTAAIAVAIGAWLFHLYGAVAGALVGFFVGQGVLTKVHAASEAAMRAAQADYDEELKKYRPEWFSADEEGTGERDPSFDLLERAGPPPCREPN